MLRSCMILPKIILRPCMILSWSCHFLYMIMHDLYQDLIKIVKDPLTGSMLFHSGALEADGFCQVLQSFYMDNLLLEVGELGIFNYIILHQTLTLTCDLCYTQYSVDEHYIHVQYTVNMQRQTKIVAHNQVNIFT